MGFPQRFPGLGSMLVMMGFHGILLNKERPWGRCQSKARGSQNDASDHHKFGADAAVKMTAGSRISLSEGRRQALPVDDRQNQEHDDERYFDEPDPAIRNGYHGT